MNLPLVLAAAAALAFAETPPPAAPAEQRSQPERQTVRPVAEKEPWRVVLASEPNSRGVRGVMLQYGRHRLCFGLQQPDGSVLPARGAMDGIVPLDFCPTQLSWVTDTCLLAFAPSAADMKPHVLRVDGEEQGDDAAVAERRSRLALIEMPGTLKGPTAKSRNLPGYNYRWHTQLELPPNLQVQVEEGVVRLLDAEGNSAFCFDCKREPVEPDGSWSQPDYRGYIHKATEAMEKSGYGKDQQVAAVFPANGRRERVVAIIPVDVRQRRGFYEFALLTPEGTLHPLGTPDMKRRALGVDFFTPGTFVWLDDDSFLLLTSSSAAAWRLAADRKPQVSPHDNLPRVGVERLFMGQFGPNRHLCPEPGKLRILFGRTAQSAEQVGEVVWGERKNETPARP